MRDNSTVPQELIDAVTDNLQHGRDRDALLACSLVCRSWRLSSQRLLFRRVTLGLDRDHSKRLGQTLLSYPHLANYCRFQHPVALDDQGKNDDESRPALERRHLSHLNLGLGFAGNCHAYVDWFLEPRSHFEVSHIRSLGVDHLRKGDEQALNRLLRTIGCSLKDLRFRVPVKGDMPSSELGFDIKLEFTPNIRCLCLTNISIGLSLGDSEMYSESFGMNWLLRLLSNIGTSNKLEEIKLEALIGTGYREACSPSGWGQIDRLLAGKFRKLQKLDIALSATWHGWDNNDEYEEVEYEEVVRCMVAAHPLLSERGVSVNVRCLFADLEELEDLMGVF
ncbi:hypothetical protein JB92DRAFT_3045439 [Gautieria morchelliformis]|nr:hypothetical protein JB92DRAFT_3045439 [Gautieria morchelliformis]